MTPSKRFHSRPSGRIAATEKNPTETAHKRSLFHFMVNIARQIYPNYTVKCNHVATMKSYAVIFLTKLSAYIPPLKY